MYVSGVDADEIIVVLNDCHTDDMCVNYNVRSGIRYVTIKNNIFEYGAHIGIVKAVEDGLVPSVNDFVMIHDTCLAGLNFKKNCEELSEYSGLQVLWATGPDRNWRVGGSFNIGIYRYEAIKLMSNILKEKMSMDKNFAIEMELKKNYMSIKNMPLSQKFHEDCKTKILGKFDVYKDGRKRDVAYIKSMDLYKFFFWVPHGSKHPNNIG